jgi:hypothetical protein
MCVKKPAEKSIPSGALEAAADCKEERGGHGGGIAIEKYIAQEGRRGGRFMPHQLRWQINDMPFTAAVQTWSVLGNAGLIFCQSSLHIK